MQKPLILLGLLVILTACSPSKAQMNSLRTEVAAEIYATLTANPQPPTPTATITLTPTVTLTATPIPTETPVPSPTLVPVVNGTILSNSLNFRDGPGTDFAIVVVLKKGDVLRVVGEYTDCAWLKVVTPDGAEGWVSGDPEFIQLDAACDVLPHGTFRPLNGTLLVDERRDFGLGQITVANGGTADGVVMLVNPTEQVVAAFYVRAGAKFTLARIPDGVYRIFITTGDGWDGEEQRFTVSPTYARFDSEFAFSTTPTQYTAWSLSLQPVAGGNETISPVDAGAFPPVK